MTKPFKNKNIIIPENVMVKLLTPSELKMLRNRWQIIQLLETGLSIREVAKQVKVGTDTVVRVSKMMKENDLHKYLSNATPKTVRVQNQTSWVFGKND